MKIIELEKLYQKLPINSISKEQIILEGILLHNSRNPRLNYVCDETEKLLIFPLCPELMQLVINTPEKTKIRVAGEIERTEFNILGMRVQKVDIL